jgi:hypothetical protein
LAHTLLALRSELLLGHATLQEPQWLLFDVRSTSQLNVESEHVAYPGAQWLEAHCRAFALPVAPELELELDEVGPEPASPVNVGPPPPSPPPSEIESPT